MTLELQHARVIVLRNTQDNHRKFYCITLTCAKRAVVMHWGRIGTRGQEDRKTFSSKGEALGFVLDKVYSKLDRGYRVVCTTD